MQTFNGIWDYHAGVSGGVGVISSSDLGNYSRNTVFEDGLDPIRLQFIDDFVNCIAENYERISEICENIAESMAEIWERIAYFCECSAEF